MTRAVHAIWGSRWGNRLPLDQLRRLALGLVLVAFTPGFLPRDRDPCAKLPDSSVMHATAAGAVVFAAFTAGLRGTLLVIGEIARAVLSASLTGA